MACIVIDCTVWDCVLQADALRLELEQSRSDNANLRGESQRIMASVSRWMAEHKYHDFIYNPASVL